MTSGYRIIDSREDRISPWIRVAAKTVASPHIEEPQVYHALRQADYVSVLAITADGRIPLVRQFRPAMERVTLELPGGLVDSPDDPEASAVRELEEETGHTGGKVTFLGCLDPDTGRLENHLWAYLITGISAAPAPGWAAEPGVEPLLYTPTDLAVAIRDGEFNHALHLALIGLAMVKGHLSLP